MKTDGIDFTDGLKVDDNRILEELNNLNINLVEPNGDETLTEVYVPKISTKTKTFVRKTIETVLTIDMETIFQNVKRKLI